MAPPSIQYSTVFGATYSADASGGDTTLVTVSLRDGDDEEGQTGHDAEVWGQAPVIYRPADPDDKGACQALTTLVGKSNVCLATRDLRAVNAMPALGPGDAAFVCPTGQGGFFTKTDGSMGILQRGKDGEKDSLAVFEQDGTFNISSKYGQIVLGPDGFHVILANGQCFSLGGEDVTMTATSMSLAAATVALGTGASAPLATVSGGIVPVTGVFVRPG